MSQLLWFPKVTRYSDSRFYRVYYLHAAPLPNEIPTLLIAKLRFSPQLRQWVPSLRVNVSHNAYHEAVRMCNEKIAELVLERLGVNDY